MRLVLVEPGVTSNLGLLRDANRRFHDVVFQALMVDTKIIDCRFEILLFLRPVYLVLYIVLRELILQRVAIIIVVDQSQS